MKKSLALWTLMAANVALGAALLARYGRENTAIAQVGRPSDYVMLPGEVSGQANAVTFLLDTTNGILGAMLFDPSRGKFSVMQPIDLNRLAEANAPAPKPVR